VGNVAAVMRTLTLLAAVLLVSACGPRLPKGVDADKLDAAVSGAIGDPNTCVLVGRKGSGQVVWRYNTNTTCARSLPSCEGAATRTVGDLLKATAADGQPRAQSCANLGWASGATPKGEFVYAAVMDGAHAMPGMMISERLEGALKDSGL
jgi:hypothetical protein